MATTSKLTPQEQIQKVEDFFALAPAFAQPILDKLRIAIDAADPDLKPTWRWGTPVYEKAGVGMVFGIGVFKQHVSVSVFQGALLPEPKTLVAASQDAKGMRSFKFKSSEEVPEEELAAYLRAAAQIKYGTVAKTADRSEIEIPEDLKVALAEKQLLGKFETMAYTHRKEYVRWVTEAKRPETRSSRIGKTVERIAAGLNFS